MKRLSKKGFTFFEGLLVVIVLCLIVGIGYYAYKTTNGDKKKVDNQSSQPTVQNTKASSSTVALTHYEFAQEKLSLSYDKDYWKVTSSQSGDIDCPIGKLKRDSLRLNHSDFNLGFNFGQCGGKGGGICFGEANSGCIRESKEISKITVSNNKSWYILASRSTTDYGKTWDYELVIDDSADCNLDICTVAATNIADDLSSINGSYSTEPDVSSLDQYAALPEVKAAISVLKTAKY